jgi:peptidoglycan-associated lipoprotein
MKSVTFCKYLTISLVLTMAGIGCKGKRHGVLTPIPNANRTGPDNESNRPGPIVPPGPFVPSDTDPHRNPGELPPRLKEGDYTEERDMFKQQIVYFAFDSSTVNPKEKSKADAVAAYLKTAPTHKVRVEGHCDERGTPGYNTALGERRALSVREYLVVAGIAPDRISTTSWGEDKPAVLGTDETAYAKNRRCEFVILIPKAP